MIPITVKDRQNLVDIAVQYYGSPASLVELCADNNLELDDNLSAGQILQIRETYPDDAVANVADYIAANGIVVTSFNDTTTVLGTNDNEIIITNNNDYIGT